MNRQLLLPGLMLLSLLILSPSVFSQGSLTPPAPPAATLKTLQQIEPRIDLQNAPAAAVDTSNANYHFIINQPGSYYLSANLGVTKTKGIQINAANVTIDLNGFEISRAKGTGGTGIEITANSHRAVARNGAIKNFNYGIETLLPVSSARGCAFRDLSVSGCTNYGILAGMAAVLESCRAEGNSGIAGIWTGPGSLLTNCTASNNTTAVGIFGHEGSVLSYCSAINNTLNSGIFGDDGSTLLNCSAFFNGDNSTGIGVNNGCKLTNCTSRFNGIGFYMIASNTIQNCVATTNQGDGIAFSNNNVARENTSDNNARGAHGAGIHATGSDNRIEGNNVTRNERGIDVDIDGNVIIRNTASGNTTNYDIVANNKYGAIVDVTSGGQPAVSGSSAASTLISTDPWANFSY